MTNKIFLAILTLGFAIALFFHHQSLDYFFFQDDFFEINISQAQNLGEYLQFFAFRDDIIAYRPITLQNFFFASTSLFGLNPVGARTTTIIFFFAAALLIIKVVKLISSSNRAAVISAFLWLTSSIHFMAISWIAAAYNIIGTFFWLLTSFIFLKFLKNNNPITYLLSLVAYLATIGSFEFSVTWPIIFGLYHYLFKRKLTETLKLFWPFLFVAAIYLAARTIFIKVPPIYEYQIIFNLDSLKAFFWYILWAGNVPEELKKQVVEKLIVFNGIFLAEYWQLTAKVFIGMLCVIFLGILFPLYKIVSRNLKIDSRLILFALAWFTIGIAPVLLLPNHTFAMYLVFPSIGLYLVIGYLLSLAKNTSLILATLAVWVITSATTISFYRINFWIVQAQKTAGEFSYNIQNQFPFLPKESIILFHLPDPWQRQALLDQHAIRTLYHDPTLLIYYNKESLLKDYPKFAGRPVYIYTPQ